MNSFDGIDKILDLAMCNTELKDYQKCFEQAKNKKETEKCKKNFKNYQFCLAKSESERLSQEKYWENFKEKWGHYPNDSK
jgi:hypothetical protein